MPYSHMLSIHYEPEPPKRIDVWEDQILPIVVTGVLLVVVGGVVAWLVSIGQYILATAIIFSIPAAVLLNAYPILSLMLWLLLMPFLPIGGVNPKVLWVVHRAMMPLGLLLHILSRMLRIHKYRPIEWGIAEWAMVLYLVFALISILLTIKSPRLYIYQLYDRMVVTFAGYWLVRFWQFDERDLKRISVVMVVICVAEIIFGFWAKYAPNTLPELWQFSRMGERMSGTFTNPTPYAYTLIFSMLFVFHYAMYVGCKVARLVLFFVFGMGLLCIFLTFTRGCWLAAALVMLGLLFMYPKIVSFMLGLSVPIIIILSTILLEDEVAFAVKRLNTQSTVDSRVVLAYAGQQMFYAKPIFGWGFSSYDRHDWKFMQRVGNVAPTLWAITQGTSHNTYLTILAETGLVGLTLQFLPLFILLARTVKVYRRFPETGFVNNKLLLSLWLSVLFYAISSQVVDMRFFWYHIGLLWVTLGLIGSLLYTYQKSSSVSVF